MAKELELLVHAIYARWHSSFPPAPKCHRGKVSKLPRKQSNSITRRLEARRACGRRARPSLRLVLREKRRRRVHSASLPQTRHPSSSSPGNSLDRNERRLTPPPRSSAAVVAVVVGSPQPASGRWDCEPGGRTIQRLTQQPHTSVPRSIDVEVRDIKNPVPRVD